MTNVIKPHYFTIQPIVNKEAVINIEDGSVETTLPITSICEHNGYEVMDHVFYINSEKELREYELLYEFAQITLEMARDYYREDFELNDIFVRFSDTKTDEPVFGLHIWNDEDGEIDFTTIGFSDLYNENNEECDCDGDCEHCSLYDHEEDFDKNVPIYYFNFEL